LVHPDIDVVSGSGFNQHAFPSLIGEATWTMPVGMLLGRAPGLSRTVGLNVGGRRVGNQIISSTRLPAASITNVVKVFEVFSAQRFFSTVFQVRDVNGHSQVDSNLLVYMLLNHTGTQDSVVSGCASPDPSSGIAACSSVVPFSWFSHDSAMTVSVYTSTGAFSDMEVVALKRPPSYESTPTGVVATLPTVPQFQGSSFGVSLEANTGATNALTSWMVTLKYDAGLVQFVGANTGGLYVDAVVVHSSGSLVLSSSSPKSGVTEAQVTGASIHLVEVVFSVLSGAPVLSYDSCFRLIVNDMINVYSLAFLQSTPGTFRDARDFGNFTRGQVVVKSREVVGILPYTTQNELVDTGAVTGVAVMSPIVVMGVNNDVDSLTNLDLSSQSICGGEDFVQLSGAQPLQVQNCVVKLTTGCHEGSNLTWVPVSYGDGNSSMSSAVPYRLWCASSLFVRVQDRILNQIEV